MINMGQRRRAFSEGCSDQCDGVKAGTIDAWISANLDVLLETRGTLLTQTPDFIICGDKYVGVGFYIS